MNDAGKERAQDRNAFVSGRINRWLPRPITPQRAKRIALQFDNNTDRKTRQSECVAANVDVNTRQVRRHYARVMAKRA